MRRVGDIKSISIHPRANGEHAFHIMVSRHTDSQREAHESHDLSKVDDVSDFLYQWLNEAQSQRLRSLTEKRDKLLAELAAVQTQVTS